jgi:hypothetical protein
MVIGHTLRVNPQFSLIFRYFQHMVVQHLRSRNLDIGHTAQLPESPSNSTDRLWRLWMVMGQAVAVYQIGVANVAKLTICIHFSQHIQYVSNFIGVSANSFPMSLICWLFGTMRLSQFHSCSQTLSGSCTSPNWHKNIPCHQLGDVPPLMSQEAVKVVEGTSRGSTDHLANPNGNCDLMKYALPSGKLT